MATNQYLVRAHTHDLGIRHLRISAASPAEAKEKALKRDEIRNVVKVYRIK